MHVRRCRPNRGKGRARPDTLKGGFRLRAAAAFEHAPGTKGGGEPCRNLRIFRVEGENGLGDEIVAEAVSSIELGGVALRECADQRAHAVRIGERKRWGGQSDRLHVYRAYAACGMVAWSDKPDLSTTSASAEHSAYRNRQRACWRSRHILQKRQSSERRHDGPSCCRLRHIAETRRDSACRFACCRQEIERDIPQGTAPGAGGIRAE